MDSVTITSEGQVTIPKQIWDYLKLATDQAQKVSCTETVTFDRKLEGEKGFDCL